MKSESGKTPLGWLITVVILVIVLGVIIAMLFVGNEDISKKLEKHQNKNTINTVQTQS